MKTARNRKRSPGSPTNASDAIDDMRLPSHPSVDERLDEGVKETFPASDPVAVQPSGETAWEKAKRR
jgi:hypothetical protein